MLRHCVWSRNLKNEEAMARVGLQRYKEEKGCIWSICVTWQGIDYKLPEDDTVVSKHVGGVW